MTCKFCDIVYQIVKNTALIADKALNTFLLGDPNETLSRRTARAANAGSRAAIGFCMVLGWISKNHCEWALEPGSIGAEIWHWSNPHGNEKTITSPISLEDKE